jgi:outer membrane receptor protein involved in Fe transport
MAPDAAMIDSVNVLTGHVPAEFGWKAGGVIEVRSASRPPGPWSGTVDAAAGNESSREFSAVGGGPLGSAAALTIGAAGQSSARFLDPVHPDNLHNEGHAFNGGAQLGWMPSPGSLVTIVTGAGRSAFDVPHDEEQEEAGQDQWQRLGNLSQTASWQRAWDGDTVSQVAGYYRYSFSTVVPGLLDTPLRTDAHRTLQRAGVLASITQQRGRHLFKIGGEAARLILDEEFSFFVVDEEEAEESNLSAEAIAHTAERPFVFEDRATPTLYSVFAQDSIQATSALTVDVGIRADWSRMLVASSQVSPRVGVSYQWPATGTTLRGSFARFFQPPQPENLLLASSPQARALSPFVEETEGGGGDLVPERQTAMDVSISQMLAHRLRVEVSAWRRSVSSASDPNVFFGTTLIVPNVVDRGRASGVDIRLELPRREGWSSYVSYANSRVVQFGPITGGLFLEDEVIEIGPGTEFTPDHDQRHVGSFGVSYDHERAGLSVSVAGRYESGTPLEVEEDELEELRGRPGAELVDFERGRVKPRAPFDLAIVQRISRAGRMNADLRVSLLNITGDRWAYNFGNPFSGTHFGPGRTFHVGVRLGVR